MKDDLKSYDIAEIGEGCRWPTKRVILSCEREPYLTRWFLVRTKHIGVFLHKFHRSDEDRELHDHPWSFLTFILWRGYIEHTPKGISRKWPGMVCYRPAEWKHRVELVDGKTAWTLVVRFTKKRMWGFWGKNGFTPWHLWWRNNCE